MQSIAIDLGNNNTRVWVAGRGLVVDEPTVIAVRVDSPSRRTVLCMGQRAWEMIGKVPGDIRAVRPMARGVIDDYALVESMLSLLIAEHGRKRLRRAPRLLIGFPLGTTPVEKRAVIDASFTAGASQVYTLAEPVAAAIGAGLSIREPQASMIVELGGGTTEIALLSLCGVVMSKSVQVGGDDMDEAIVNHVRETRQFRIGQAQAATLKHAIGSAMADSADQVLSVRGKNIRTGLPDSLSVAGGAVYEAIRPLCNAIADAVLETLSRCPPELAGDLHARGLVLTGAGALLRDIDRFLAARLCIPIARAEKPEHAVIRGLGQCLEQFSTWKELLEPARQV